MWPQEILLDGRAEALGPPRFFYSCLGAKGDFLKLNKTRAQVSTMEEMPGPQTSCSLHTT